MARGAIAYKGQLYLGGSKVEANPTGSAEGGNLSKLGVDDTVYAIPQVNNGTLTIQKNGTNVATFSANQSENVTANIDVSEDIAGTQTVSGNPLTLTDCAPINAESLVVELEPIQDLHGQSAPYVGGAGKNKLPMTVDGIKAANTEGTWNGNVYTINGGTFTIQTDNGGNVTGIKANGTFNADATLFVLDKDARITSGSYIASKGNTVAASTMIVEGYNGSSWVRNIAFLSSNESASISIDYSGYDSVSVYVGCVANNAFNNVDILPMIRLATETDPTFAPYSNICPITGYTECEVDDVGHNQWDEEWRNGYYDASGSFYTDANYLATKKPIPVKGNKTYYFYCNSGNFGRLVWTDIDGNFISTDVLQNKNFTKISPNNAMYLQFDMVGTYGAVYKHDISINYPSTFTEYVPYHSSNATIQFGQTVYGGSVDFLTGVLTVDKGFDTFDGSSDENWIWYGIGSASSYACYIEISPNANVSVRPKSNYATGLIQTDTYGNYDCFVVASSANILIAGKRDKTSVADWKAFLASNPLQVCYELATPFTIQLTPDELKLLKNTNNLSTNGTTINLGYQPDNVIGEAIKVSEEYTDRRMDALGDLAYINEDGDNSTKFLRGDGTWQNTPAGVTTLAALTDTTISSPSNGQVLKYDGSKWVNSADYSLPKASADTLGGVKVGANLSIDSNGVLSATGGGGGGTPTIVDSDDVYISADQAYVRFRKYSNGMKSIHIYSLGFSAGTHSGIVPNKYMPIGMDRTMSEGYRYLNLTGHSPADYSIRSLTIEFVGDTSDGNLIMAGTSQGIAVDAFYI